MQHKATISVTQSESGSSSGPTVNGTTYTTGSVAASVDQVYGVVTDTALPIAFTVANVQSLVMLSTKDVTLKANSSTSPTDTINLKAGTPLIWQAGGYFTSPLSNTTTMANFYVTTTASTRLQILVISN